MKFTTFLAILAAILLFIESYTLGYENGKRGVVYKYKSKTNTTYITDKNDLTIIQMVDYKIIDSPNFFVVKPILDTIKITQVK